MDELPNATKVYKLSKQEYDTLLEAIKIGSFVGFVAGGIAARIKKFRPGATILTCFVTTLIGSTIGSANGMVVGYRTIQTLPNKQNVYMIIRDLHQEMLKMKLPQHSKIKLEKEKTDQATNDGNDDKYNQPDILNTTLSGSYAEIENNDWNKTESMNSKPLSSWDRIHDNNNNDYDYDSNDNVKKNHYYFPRTTEEFNKTGNKNIKRNEYGDII
ncbi:2309_t:CDS:2 [Entrophospora sp. SA101]|nr:21443_t:CDS:2 [Entrophospora sp. SA101]CAJ0767080.1 2309_t:CDS:2 [Entrophospora sp. SA101]CAJ0904117.1 11506_t:CDS:2 [Entrophospora sp. SA101]CAJ0904137.1 11510_t:CDS:2 [Entrophospora sp. SA101]CAJ0907094.1 12054_t:CDS:2 [Entrophospora sp. SA101]